MLYPDSFSLHRISTTLGTLVAYRKDEATVDSQAIPSTHKLSHPPLAFFHGFGGGSSAYEWSQVYPAFTADYSVVAYDLLGWGRSHHLDRAYRLDDYLSNLEEILATLQPAPIVVASSLTAAMMIRLAVQKPESIRALLLVAPSGLSDFGEDYSRSPFAQLVSTPMVDRVLYATAIATSFGIRSFLENRQFARRDRINNEIIEAYLASAQQPNAEYSALSFVRGDLCFDLAEDIPQLAVPTAIFWGQQSQFTSVELGKRLAALNPQAIRNFNVIENAGLTPQLEVPAVLIGKMRQVLREFGLAST
ncbi:alpha/beta fold hydrolase [Vacuolonema iberomarrocanum]|uniref:alpha/beta fold hydrolase n=1 Tax=Vacuolonema iberomarrocanum TaxID=3454632 RepID=UPI0019DC6AD0|nr:alpha/beta hydrolase [filamentous cyanobacterium LEGE 07170]